MVVAVAVMKAVVAMAVVVGGDAAAMMAAEAVTLLKGIITAVRC